MRCIARLLQGRTIIALPINHLRAASHNGHYVKCRNRQDCTVPVRQASAGQAMAADRADVVPRTLPRPPKKTRLIHTRGGLEWAAVACRGCGYVYAALACGG